MARDYTGFPHYPHARVLTWSTEGPPEREHLRPRIGWRDGEVPQERVPRLRNALLSRIARIGRSSRPGRGCAPGMFSERDVPRPRASARRCVVKARFVAMNTYGTRAASLHLACIECDGVDVDGSPGRLYGPVDAADLRESCPHPSSPRSASSVSSCRPKTASR